MIEPLLIIPVGLVVVGIVGYIAHRKHWKIVEFF